LEDLPFFPAFLRISLTVYDKYLCFFTVFALKILCFYLQKTPLHILFSSEIPVSPVFFPCHTEMKLLQ